MKVWFKKCQNQYQKNNKTVILESCDFIGEVTRDNNGRLLSREDYMSSRKPKKTYAIIESLKYLGRLIKRQYILRRTLK